MARSASRTLDRASGMGGRVQPADVFGVRGAMDAAAKNAVHAVSLALAAVPEHDLHASCIGWTYVGTAALGCRVEQSSTWLDDRAALDFCLPTSGDRGGMALRPAAVVGQQRRSRRDAGQYSGTGRLRWY